MKRSREMNLCEGSILKKLILYSLPFIATNVLQLLFNVADVVIVGIYENENVVGAVSSTGALVNLCVGLFIGLSVSANVMIAKAVGSKDKEQARRVVGMSVLVSLLFGVLVAAIGFFGCGTFLKWMDCKPEHYELAKTYLKIYFLGLPIVLLYNYCASILRGAGDTVRPFIFLVIAGVLNVLLNVLLVTVFHLSVAGVAIATVASQGVSALCCMIVLIKEKEGFASFKIKYFHIYPREFLEMLKVGIPAGVQGCMFSLSNVLIQSTVYQLGPAVTNGHGVAAQIDGFIYTAMNAVSLSVLAFIGQNLGAGRMDRVKKALGIGCAVNVTVGLVLATTVILLRKQLCGIIADDPEVLKYAYQRLFVVGGPYFLCGIMEVLCNALRALGKSAVAMVISLFWACVFRIVWIKLFLPLWPTYIMLDLVYPISQIFTIICYLCFIIPFFKRHEREIQNAKAAREQIAAEMNASPAVGCESAE